MPEGTYPNLLNPETPQPAVTVTVVRAAGGSG